MAGLAFLSKKSWHVSNISNQEKVWLAEQKAASEAQKTKELQEQIKAEREREEFDKLANKKSVGDRGTNWMYEGHGISGEDAGTKKREAVQAVEDAKNEAYLLGKEYVPEGQAKNSGDFAMASTMTGALEKASTYGATIGVGTNNNTEGGGSSSTLRIQDSGTTTAAVSSGGLVDDHNTEWNQEFHLRHEDPMFAVQQKQKQQVKDVEKKKRLMERAGLEVQPVMVKGNDGNYDQNEKRLREDHEESIERHLKKKKKRKHHSKSSRKSKKSRKHKKRKHRDRSPSYSSDESYSSSSVSSRGRRDGDRYHHKRKHDGRKQHRHSSSRRGKGKDDDYSSSRHGYSRSRSIDRNYTREDRYANDDNGSRKHSSERRSNHHHQYRHGRRSRSYSSRRSPSYSRSRSRDEKKHSSSMRKRANGDNLSNNDNDRKNNQRHHDDKYDDNHDNKDDQGGNASTKKKTPGYGLIGTSLSDRKNNSSTTKQQPKQDDYLGPNQKLLAAKRDEIKHERQSRLEEAGRGTGGRKGGGEGYSREERLKEMERMARDRLR